MTLMMMMMMMMGMMMVDYGETGHRSGRRLIVRVQKPSFVVGWTRVDPAKYKYWSLICSSFYLKTSSASGSVHGSKWLARSLGTLQRLDPSDNRSI